MEELLAVALRAADSAEVYSSDYTIDRTYLRNSQIADISSRAMSGVSIRVIKDGRLGFAYTRNLRDRKELLQHALASLACGAAVDFSFPHTGKIPALNTVDPAMAALTATAMVHECQRIGEELSAGIAAEVTVDCLAYREHVRIINSTGTDVSRRSTEYACWASLATPGSAYGIHRTVRGKGFQLLPAAMIAEMKGLYRIAAKIVQPKGGAMKALFMPNSVMGLSWRIASGVNLKNVYEGVSPIADKSGQKLFDERINIRDDPLDDSYPAARAFDDEGVACKPCTLYAKGVLQGFYSDLNYAGKLKAASTGHGYRKGALISTADPITLQPMPALANMRIEPGEDSLADLVQMIDRGVIIESAQGYHSGNIPNGDYSIGIVFGFYVENGEILGRVKNAMAAGNIYESLQRVVAVGDSLHPSQSAWVPALLLDGVNIVIKD